MASLYYTGKTAYRAVWANKVRSGLTVLGIVIGITAIILIVSLGQGAQGLILGQIQGLGAETIVLRPGREPKGPTDFAQTLFADSIRERELEALKRKENVPELVSMAPVIFISDAVSYRGEVEHPSIFGWSAEFMINMTKTEVERGTIFDETDIKQTASVAVLGNKVAGQLFGNDDPVEKSIRIRNTNFRVVAVLKKGNSGLFNVDSMVIVPYTAAMTYLSQQKHYSEVMIKVSSPEMVARSVGDITATLRELHNITDPAKDDFYMETQQGTIKQIGTILSVLTTFLSAVVAISLVVGGIGVMNVMLVSVTERTREIGLRKALGARNSDILRQFLIEAVMLTMVGGAIGIALGVFFGYLVSIVLSGQLGVSWVFAFPWTAMLIGLGVSASVGIVFGIYPASKASKKSPIEALRYE
ncbi:MAG TPA: ABC transporter permease [Candidatus Paceibacterota bacterium]